MSEASGPTRDPAGAIFRTAAASGSVATVIAAGVMLLVDGGPAAGSAAIGGVIAVAALAVGPLVMRLAGQLSPVGVYTAALSAYAGVVLVLAIVYAVLGAQEWLRGEATAVGMLAAAAASLAGQLLTTRRLRTLVYQDTELPS